ncbi:MAG TPA: alpha/beta hydrolase [Pyrinomonadaceae bacterium]|nr:alpha/beta hydrolase [Pyrinomonadaceae bacterium]
MKGKLVVRVIALVAAALLLVLIGGIGFVYLAPETATHTFLTIERKRSGLVRKEIDLPDGTHYVYLEGGQGEPLMLLHGFGGNKDGFTRVARFLTSHYRVIIPDHIGFGESAHPPDADYTPIAQANRLHSLAQALGVADLHLGGSSMGGQIAMSYAALYPTEVKSLWLLDPAGIWSAPESELRKIIRETGHNPLLAQNEAEFAQLFPFVMAEPPFIPRPMMDVLAQERIRNFDLEKKIFLQITADSLEGRISGMTIPTLIVWGDRDRTINVATAEILHRLMPNSRVIIMPEIGHLPMIERPQQSAEDLLRFRASL